MACTFGALFLFLLGCSGGTGPVDVVSPELEVNTADQQIAGVTEPGWGFLGYWHVSISEDLQTVEIVPMRAAEMHLNLLMFLEHGPCDDCLLIHEVVLLPDNLISVLMVVKHPYPGWLPATAFDIRGIFMSGSDYDFPNFGKAIAWGDEVPRMVGYDGYTSLFNPTDFPQTFPPALGYIPGNKATGGELTATVNPYAAFKEDEARCMFEAWGLGYNYLQIHVKHHPIEFGYAVEGCWQEPNKPVTDPVNDFPEDANCLEAYRIDVAVGAGIEAGGGSASIMVTAYDHQGNDTVESVSVEAPDLFNGLLDLDYSTSYPDGRSVYEGVLSNDNGAGYGEYPVLVRVVDTEADQNLGQIDAWQLHVQQIKKGWVLTLGGTLDDSAYDVEVDSSNNIYVAGNFMGVVDFDPGPGIEERTSHLNFHGDYIADCYVAKYDQAGALIWVNAWGGTIGDTCLAIAIDSNDNICVTGFFTGTADFDPGGGVDEHTANGMCDVFLSVFGPSGNFKGATTWGGPMVDAGFGVAVDDSGAAYVTGFYQLSADFDPGDGEDIHTSNGSADVYVVKLDSAGEFQWANTWGGSGFESGQSVGVNSSGIVYLTGYFVDVVDFDPGPGTDNRTSKGGNDAFMSMFNSDGTLAGVYTWGASMADSGDDVYVDSSDNVYIAGRFQSAADLDPTGGMDVHITNGDSDGYVIKLDSGGVFQWARSWGGVSDDSPLGIAVDSSNKVFVTGKFRETSDFDPGAGVDMHSSYGLNDVFLSRFDLSGGFEWARTWGGTGQDYGMDVATDGDGNAYVVGYFGNVVDFDAGPGFDMRTSEGPTDAFLCKYPPDGDW